MTLLFAALTSLTFAVPGAASPHSAMALARPVSFHSQPRFEVMAEVGIGSPTGLLGARVGYTNGTRWGLEVGGGVGLTGYQTSLMGRLYQRVGRKLAFSLGAGPSLALNGPRVGRSIEHLESIDTSGQLYYASWFNAEGAMELRFSNHGLFFRGAIGVNITMKENMAALCRGVAWNADNNPPNEGCAPPHTPSGPEYVARPANPYLTGTVGWRF